MIAIDWGTSSLRAYRLDAGGSVIDQRSTMAGLLHRSEPFETVLSQQIAGWDDASIFMAGMVGSRNGWVEVPYVECPAGLEEIASGTREVEGHGVSGRRLWIVPGVVCRPAEGAPEVMRGEETQALGLLAQLNSADSQWICLPGTHSKWVRVERGRVVSLRTAMTGEFYALLRRHSLLAALMPDSKNSDPDDLDAFVRGVVASGGSGGLLHQLFGVRTLRLFDSLAAEEAPSYLSGLLIGHELRSWKTDVSFGIDGVHLIGGTHLLQRYTRAWQELGVRCQSHCETLTAHGLYLVSQHKQL